MNVSIEDLNGLLSAVTGRSIRLSPTSPLLGDAGTLDSLAIGALLLEVEEFTGEPINESDLTIEVFSNVSTLLDFINRGTS